MAAERVESTVLFQPASCQSNHGRTQVNPIVLQLNLSAGEAVVEKLLGQAAIPADHGELQHELRRAEAQRSYHLS